VVEAVVRTVFAYIGAWSLFGATIIFIGWLWGGLLDRDESWKKPTRRTGRTRGRR
jgi:hypothetical protein